MARMTPGEAAAVNVLVGFFVGQASDPPREVVLALETPASRAQPPSGWSLRSIRAQPVAATLCLLRVAPRPDRRRAAC